MAPGILGAVGLLLANFFVLARCAEPTMTVQIRIAWDRMAGSAGHFEFLLAHQPAGLWRPLPLGRPLERGEVRTLELPVEGPSGPVLYFGLKNLGMDAVGIDSIRLGDLEVVTGLPFWLDNPCDSPGPGCAPLYVWSVVLPTTTSTVTTFTATTSTETRTLTTTPTTTTGTVTATSTSTSRTVTTSTTTTATSTSTHPLPVVRERSDFIPASVAPEPFYDQLELDLTLDVNKSVLNGRDPNEFAPQFGKILEVLTGLKPPSGVRCIMSWKGGSVRVRATFAVMPGSPVSALDVQNLCRRHGFVQDLNTRITDIGIGDVEARASDYDVHLAYCRPGALFCCVHAVVHNILKNAGVMLAYKGTSFICLFMVLAMTPVFLEKFCFVFRECSSDEERRGRFVMPMMIAGAASQALVVGISAYNKYVAQAEVCGAGDSRELLETCPPDITPLVLEEVVIGFLAFFFLIGIWRWWYREWCEDCAIGDPPEGSTWRPVTPLESMLRRSHLWCILEMRKEDRLSRCDLVLLTTVDILLTFCAVLTSFFMLQQYRFPGMLVAWHPYKMIYELMLGSIFRHVFRLVALRLCRGKFRLAFVCLGLLVFGVADIVIWTVIGEAVVGDGSRSLRGYLRLVDVAFAAGMVSYLLAQLCASFILRFISVYLYEPRWRYRVLRCTYIVEESSIRQLEETLRVSKGVWKIKGVRHPPQLRQLDKAFAKRIKAAVRSQSEASSEVRALLRQGDISEAKPLVLQLQRADSRWAAAACSLLDMLFGVEKHLPVEPRWKRAQEVGSAAGGSEQASLVDSQDSNDDTDSSSQDS